MPEPKRKARELLKFDGGTDANKLADHAWNAAWDLWFLRMPEGHTFGMMPPNRGGNEVTALVTRDNDLTWLREAGSIRALVGAGTDRHILTEVQLDVRPDAVGEAILGLVNEKLCRVPSLERLLRDPDDVSKAALGAVADLERQIGVAVLSGSRA